MLVEVSVVEQRYDAVKEVLADGLSVTEVAERYGVARQTVHRWIARYQRGGLGALADRSHRPDSCPHQMPAVIEARILELRRVHAEWGAGADPLRPRPRTGPTHSGTLEHLSGAGSSGGHPGPPAQEAQGRLPALGAPRPDGALAARRHGPRVPRRSDRAQGRDRDRRPLAVRPGPARATRYGAAGLRGVLRGASPLRAPRGGADGQRQGVHRAVRTP